MKKTLVLFVLALCLWVNETKAQSCCGEESLPPHEVNLTTDRDGTLGVIIAYGGQMSMAHEVHIQTGACVHILGDVRMKRNGKGSKAVFVPSSDFSVVSGVIYYKTMPIMDITLVCDNSKASQ
jgi:hypothetical protein